MSTAAPAQTGAAVLSLPIGSPLTIIADETVNDRVRPGSEFRAHLRDPLALGDRLVATSGTPAKLVVVGKDTATDGTASYRIAIIDLNLGLAGTLPIAPTTPRLVHIAAGMAIPVTTLASVGLDGGTVRVAVPLPFRLSNEPPNGGFTPAPLRTAAPIINRRRPTPTPVPSPAASSPATATPPVPSPAALPSALPT